MKLEGERLRIDHVRREDQRKGLQGVLVCALSAVEDHRGFTSFLLGLLGVYYADVL
jgi:hypothetical protein